MSPQRSAAARLASGLGRVLLGPWPLYPRAIALLVAYGMLIRAIVRALSQGVEGRPWLGLLAPNLVTMALVALVAWGGAKVLPKVADRVVPPAADTGGRVRYAALIVLESLVVAGALVALVRGFLPDHHSPVQPGVLPVALFSALMVLVTVAFANGVAGLVLERFRREEELVRAERSLQLAAEERVRAETARYLHDDVQTALLRASLRLVPLLDRAGSRDDRELLCSAIAEIDAIRDEGVRNVGRRLAPPLASTGLLVALHELGSSYEGVMHVEVAFDDAAAERFRIVDEDDRVALAVYRLTEQALQNALKHGGAAGAHVGVSVPSAHEAVVVVEADGAPPARERMAGNGTAIINAWLDDIGGSWSLDSAGDGGSCFRASLALRP